MSTVFFKANHQSVRSQLSALTSSIDVAQAKLSERFNLFWKKFMNTTNLVQTVRVKKWCLSPPPSEGGQKNANHDCSQYSALTSMLNTIKPSCRQLGMTLIEIMIAMLVGAFLLGGVLQVFIGSKQTNRMQENLSRLQENGRFAIDLINHDIRMAGFQGCNSIVNVPINSINALPIIPASNTIITGNEAIPPIWTPALPAASVTPIAGTDVITLLHGNSCGGNLTVPMATTASNIQIAATNTCGIGVGSALLIADCANADIFLAAAGTVDPNITHAALSVPYSSTAELFTYSENSYFINNGANGRPALWRFDNAQAAGGNNPVEFVEGIENMQVLYGEDTDLLGTDGKCTICTPNYYVTANNVVDPSRVVSIRISLLAATPDDNLTAQAVPYTYNGVTITPNDRRIRRVFTSTISIRNRLL